MLLNSEVSYEELSMALYRAALYVGFSDNQGGKEAQDFELRALSVFINTLKEQSTEEGFLSEISKAASGDLSALNDLKNSEQEEFKNLTQNLDKVPKELEDVMRRVVENFSKQEARLYTDIIISAMASVAQANDEKDDMTSIDDGIFGHLSDMTQIFERFLVFFINFHESPKAKYLYEESDIHDQMKISTKETDAMAKVCSSIKGAWIEKYPEDSKQTVQEYLAEKENR